MEKNNNSITFLCPGCKDTFEFDSIGEYQLVSCPICGIEWMTIRKNQTLLLEPFDFSSQQNEVKAIES